MPRPRSIRDEDLLDATARVVDRLGPHRFTLADVAQEAGVSAPLLLQRFGTKRGLLIALVSRSPAEVEQTFARARSAHPAPLDALVAALADLGVRMRTPQAVAHGLAFLQLDLTDAEFNEHARAWFVAFRAAIARQLDEAVRAGDLKRVDVAALARGVETTYNGAQVSWAIQREGTCAEAVQREVLALLEPHRARLPKLL